MRKLQSAVALAVLLAASPALAQGTGAEQPGAMTAESILPQGCLDAMHGSGMSGMTQGTDMSAMPGSMGGMNEAQRASMQAMMATTAPMMATHTIDDPDLAFYCGMIVHHTGAIAMSEIELRYGRNEETKAMAQDIIDAQRKEIEEMTAWIEENTRKQ